MRSKEIKAKRYNQRKRRVRAKIIGNAARPRLSVFRSNTHIYGQIINDEDGKTLISYSDLKIKKEAKMTKTMIASQVGEEIAKKAIAKKIKRIMDELIQRLPTGRRASSITITCRADIEQTVNKVP